MTKRFLSTYTMLSKYLGLLHYTSVRGRIMPIKVTFELIATGTKSAINPDRKLYAIEVKFVA